MRSKFSLYVLAMIVAAFGLAIAGCGDDDDDGGGGGANVSGQSLDQRRLDRPGGEVVPGRAGRVHEGKPRCDGQVQPGGRPDPDRAVDGGPGRQPARPRSGRAAGPRAGLRRAKAPASRSTSPRARSTTTSPRAPSTPARSTASPTACCSRRPTSRPSGTTSRSSSRRASSRRRTSTPSSRTPKTLRSSGTRAYSIGAADGWTLTDLFENIYLRQAGPEKYDQLAEHEIPWTDQSVKDALDDDGEDRRRHGQHRGRHARARSRRTSRGSVTNAFKENPDAAQVIEGDFVESEITDSTPAKPETGFNVFDFPAIDGSGADGGRWR